MSDARFHGMYPMLYAFFDGGGGLDRDAMTRQVEGCIAAGAHGLAVGGLASECNKLSSDEKRQLAEWVLGMADGRLPVSVTITEPTQAGQIAAAKAAADQGADWIVLQPPPVKSASEEDLIRFFGGVADACPVPVGIQNAPQFIGIGLSDAALIDLNRHHPNVSVLKAEGNAIESAKLAEAAKGAFTLFNGRNGIDLIDTLRAGFHGVIPSPDVIDRHVRVYELYRAGESEAAERAFKEIVPLLLFLMTSIEHLVCYGKRLTAQRVGIEQVHDRLPAERVHPFGLSTLAHWSRDLGSLGAN